MFQTSCPRCGHIQDAGSALENWHNKRCDACGCYFSLARRHPWVMVALGLIGTLSAWHLEMPMAFVVTSAILTAWMTSRALRHSQIKNKLRSHHAANQLTPANISSKLPAPLIYTPRELATALTIVAGRRIHITHPRGAEGPQTAARLVGGEFNKHGARLVSSSGGADVSVDIHEKHAGLFRFSVSEPSNQKTRHQIECGPRELTAAIMAAVCEFLRESEGGKPDSKTVERRVQLLQKLDQGSDQNAEELARVMNWRRDELVDALLYSANDLNRKITGALVAMEYPKAASHVEQLARRVTALGQLGDERGVGTILDALADAAESYHATRFHAAQVLRDTAIEALVTIGAAAVGPVKERLQHADSYPAFKHSLEAVQERLKREYS
jgi:hypothetical protein